MSHPIHHGHGHHSPGVDAGGPVQSSGVAPSDAGLEMDTVLALVETKYGNLTKIFNDAMDEEKARQEKLTHVHNAKEALQAYGGKDIDPSEGAHYDNCKAAAQKACDELKAAGYPDSDPAVTQLHDLVNKSGAIGGGDVDNALKQIDAAESNLTGDSQLKMLSLQDTMSKVQTLMSMATNLEATIHDMQKSIVANMHV